MGAHQLQGCREDAVVCCHTVSHGGVYTLPLCTVHVLHVHLSLCNNTPLGASPCAVWYALCHAGPAAIALPSQQWGPWYQKDKAGMVWSTAF